MLFKTFDYLRRFLRIIPTEEQLKAEAREELRHAPPPQLAVKVVLVFNGGLGESKSVNVGPFESKELATAFVNIHGLKNYRLMQVVAPELLESMPDALAALRIVDILTTTKEDLSHAAE